MNRTVLVSRESEDGLRCVDIFRRADMTFGFEEFRRDPEDQGRWTRTGYYSDGVWPTMEDAEKAARAAIRWLSEREDRS